MYHMLMIIIVNDDFLWMMNKYDEITDWPFFCHFYRDETWNSWSRKILTFKMIIILSSLLPASYWAYSDLNCRDLFPDEGPCAHAPGNAFFVILT